MAIIIVMQFSMQFLAMASSYLQTSPRRQESPSSPPIKKLWLVIHTKQPACLAMGRDVSFQWQPPSQWGEMVRLGMGLPFKTLLFFYY